MDNWREVYVQHMANKESKNELEGRKDKRFVPGRKRRDRRQVVIASKDQIQHPSRYLVSCAFCELCIAALTPLPALSISSYSYSNPIAMSKTRTQKQNFNSSVNSSPVSSICRDRFTGFGQALQMLSYLLPFSALRSGNLGSWQLRRDYLALEWR